MPPSIVLVAGPNGAGESTDLPRFLLRDTFAVSEFVNPDQIAQSLSAFSPETVALSGRARNAESPRRAGRRRATFAFETTLASRSFAPMAVRPSRSGAVRR